MYKSILFILSLCFVGFACQTSTTPAATAPTSILSPSNDSLYQLVGKKHDEVMPKTGNIEALQRDLQAQLGTAAGTRKDSLLTVLGHLQQAHDGMMNWMRQFKGIDLDEAFYKERDEAQIKTYLQEEERKIEEVARQMLSSIAEGEQLATKK